MSGARILVVDDTPRNVKLLADLLAASGYEAVTAASGAEALDQVAAARPDLVLLDVVMPGMSGYEVCRAIREDPATATLPVVLVTALESAAERLQGIEAGADDFLTKPIQQAELLARVRSLLRIKHLHDTVERQAEQLAQWNRRLEERVAAQVSELERLGRLKRFLAPQLVERIVAGGADEALRSHRREIAVVSLELRGFPAFAETTEPEEVMALLEEHHRAIGGLVMEHEGTLERFTGEAALVFFNDPVPQADAAARAVGLALAVRERSRDLFARWARRGVALDLGLGVTQGYATLGAIGFEARSDYAAIGTVTSLAARLSEAARPSEILASQRLAASVETLVDLEPAGELELRGFPRPVLAVRVLRPRHAAGDERDVRAPRAIPAERSHVFVREGEVWTIEYRGESTRLRDSKGLRYVAQLLAHPEREFHALDLVAIAQDGAREPSAPAGDPGATVLGALADTGAILDARAKGEYRERIGALRAELADAEASTDGRAPRIREEIEALSQQLAAAVGLGGRDRRAGGAGERARVNVTRAISDGLRRLREHAPLLARHLDASIRTGAFCVYQPPDLRDARWRT